MMKCCVVMIGRSIMHERKYCCMVDAIILFFYSFACCWDIYIGIYGTLIGWITALIDHDRQMFADHGHASSVSTHS